MIAFLLDNRKRLAYFPLYPVQHVDGFFGAISVLYRRSMLLRLKETARSPLLGSSYRTLDGLFVCQFNPLGKARYARSLEVGEVFVDSSAYFLVQGNRPVRSSVQVRRRATK